MYKMHKSGENIRFISLLLLLVLSICAPFISAQSLIVDKITVKGNSILPQKEILSVLKMREESLFYSYIYYSDIDAIKILYQHNGFPEAFVEGSYEITETNKVHLLITIREGKPQMITDISLDGSTTDFSPIIKAYKNERWSISVEDTIRIRIITALQEKGYFKPTVTIIRAISEQYAVTLTVDVAEGTSFTFGNIFVNGNVVIPRNFITREADYATGDLFVKSEVVEFQERLYKLSVFSDVNIKLIDSNGAVDTIVDVKEDKFKWIGFDFGFTSPATGRFGVEWGNMNFMGFLTKVSLVNKNEVDFKNDNYKLSLGITAQKQWLLGKRVTFDGSLLTENEKQEKYGLLSVKLTASLKKEFFKNVFMIGGFEKSITSYDRLTNDISEDEDIPLDSWLTSNALFLNPYCDTIKNKMHPVDDSMYFSVYSKLVGGFLGGNWQYFQTMIETSLYKNIYDHRVVSVFHAQYKGMSPLGNTLSVPVDELFSLGGAYDIRGYDYAGIGSEFYTVFYVNKEERIKLYGDWWGEIFLDAGFGLMQDEQLSADNVKYGAGAGIRYVLPFIIVRADYAYRLIGREYQFHFAIGQVF